MRLQRLVFEPGATWLAFTDQVPHAVAAGRFLLEQTFYLALGRCTTRPPRRCGGWRR